MISKTYSSPLPIHTHCYGLPSGTYLCSDLSMAPSRGEEHDPCNAIRLYKDPIREDAMELNSLLASVRAPTQQELNIAEGVAAYNTGNMEKVAHIDEHEEECCKRKAYHHNVCKYCASISKTYSSNEGHRS